MHVQCKNCNIEKWVATDAVTKDQVLNTLRFVNEEVECCQYPDYKRIPTKIRKIPKSKE